MFFGRFRVISWIMFGFGGGHSPLLASIQRFSELRSVLCEVIPMLSCLAFKPSSFSA